MDRSHTIAHCKANGYRSRWKLIILFFGRYYEQNRDLDNIKEIVIISSILDGQQILKNIIINVWLVDCRKLLGAALQPVLA